MKVIISLIWKMILNLSLITRTTWRLSHVWLFFFLPSGRSFSTAPLLQPSSILGDQPSASCSGEGPTGSNKCSPWVVVTDWAVNGRNVIGNEGYTGSNSPFVGKNYFMFIENISAALNSPAKRDCSCAKYFTWCSLDDTNDPYMVFSYFHCSAFFFLFLKSNKTYKKMLWLMLRK